MNRGDASAFNTLYARHRDWVVRLARRFSRNDADALDVLQETFSYLLRKFPGFRLTSSLRTFLFPAVKHLALTARRRAGRNTSNDLALQSVPDRTTNDSSIASSDLLAVLGALPESHRDVLLMRFVDGLSLAEIAKVSAIPLGTVKSRLHNGLNMLRENPKTKAYFKG